MHFERTLAALAAALLVSSLCPPPAGAVSIGGGQLVEDFSTDQFADYTATNGLWNIVNNQAQAAVVANQDSTKTISYGDGSDGALNSSTGFAFDTNAHPNGYFFSSVNITGGAITVSGANPLVIYSLTTVNITPSLSVNGANGGNGSTGPPPASAAGGASGAAVTCAADGGAGGAASTTASANGLDGLQSSGAEEFNTAGSGITGSGYNGAVEEANFAADGPSTPTDFEGAGEFICGAGGGGGGGLEDGGTYATGGGGGAGGGIVRVAAVGNVTFSSITANGGNGGNGAGPGGFCSGSGSAGVGGSIWVQSFNTVTGTSFSVTGGSPGSSACGSAGSAGGISGQTRIDATTNSGPAANATFSTADAAASQPYTVQSKAYPLSTVNASFSSANVSSTLNGGTIAVAYAGSSDGVNFSPFTASISSLSNQGYAYLKFRISITTGAAAAASPVVSRIAISFFDISVPTGPSSLDLALSGGCGTIAQYSRRGGSSGGNGGGSHPPPAARALVLGLGPWAILFLAAHRLLRRRRRQLPQAVFTPSRAEL